MYTSTTLLQPYLGADNPESACYGLTTSLYVPNGSDLQLGPFAPKLAPMQAPYVVQKTLEQGLRFPFSAVRSNPTNFYCIYMCVGFVRMVSYTVLITGCILAQCMPCVPLRV
jgi:hypothetical protein